MCHQSPLGVLGTGIEASRACHASKELDLRQWNCFAPYHRLSGQLTDRLSFERARRYLQSSCYGRRSQVGTSLPVELCHVCGYKAQICRSSARSCAYCTSFAQLPHAVMEVWPDRTAGIHLPVVDRVQWRTSTRRFLVPRVPACQFQMHSAYAT